MNRLSPAQVKRFLRSPKVIVGQIALIALACVAGAIIPQAQTASASLLVRLFALDHVFRSAWFATLCLLAAGSLPVVVSEQVRRFLRLWSQRLTESHFRHVPFRAEFERPPRLRAGERETVEMRSHRRIGLAGSPVFHLGLLIAIIGAALRALFSVEAAVDLIEGETLPPTAAAWGAQWPGLLAAPFRLECPVRLEAVQATNYERGDLRDLRIRLSLERAGRTETRGVAINRELRAPGGRLFLGSDFGPAALLEWTGRSTSSTREALFLASKGAGRYEGKSTGPDGMCVYLQARVGRDGKQLSGVEARVMKGGALLYAGTIRAGDRAVLAGDRALMLHGVPFWVRVRGSRDPALWLVYFGFALLLAGATIIFTMVKVDTCIIVTRAGEKERVIVALRPHRFPPLFKDRFERLLRDQGGIV